MAAIPNEFSISLRPWPSTNSNDALPSIIQRINFERGGFQNITEESLRQEIIEEELNNDNDGASSSEDEEEPDRAKELNTAREEFIGQIEQAHQTSMLALDFISLLLSKDAPVQASLSLSPDLQALVGTKTLGADKLAAPRITEAQKQDNKKVAKGWKIQHLDRTVDSILASATRLEKEIEHETKYWEQVLAVSEKGWAVCRLPNQKHILGVRFGFSEASPAFKSRSLAALKRNRDGTISLDQGLADAEPKTLRVRIEVNGEYTGISTMPKAVPQNSPIEALILQARNTIFSEELWQELNRESRILEPVHSKDNTLKYQLSAKQTMILDLVPLGEESVPANGPDAAVAESTFFALNILLSYAHRQAHRRRCQLPPPISSDKRPNPPLNLLRPFIARAKHQETIGQLHQLFRPLHRVLTSASLNPPPSYTLIPTIWPQLPHVSTAERTILALSERLEITATFTITPTTTVTVKAQTHSHPAIFTQFILSISPASSPLHATCPAPTRLESLTALQEYIYYATSCALASMFSPPSPSPSPSPNLDPTPHQLPPTTNQWIQTTHPNILQRADSDSRFPQKLKQLALSIHAIPHPSGPLVMLRAQWEWMRGELSGEGDLGWTVRSRRSSIWDSGPGAGLGDASSGKGKVGVKAKRGLQGEGSYTWVAREGQENGGDGEWGQGEGEVVKGLEEVVERAGR